MQSETHAHYALLNLGEDDRKRAVEYLIGRRTNPPQSAPVLAEVTDPAARLELLAQLTATDQKDFARTGDRHNRTGLLWWYKPGATDYSSFLKRQMRTYVAGLNLQPALPDLGQLPARSWAFQFTFVLRKPYLSHNDADFYIIDNPLKKEWVFRIPYVAPSQWKGALRSAAIRRLVEQLQQDGDEAAFAARRLQLVRLYGNEKDGAERYLNAALARHRAGGLPADADQEARNQWQVRLTAAAAAAAAEFERDLRRRGVQQGDVEGFSGSLTFYPTYFDAVALEVINPHSRDSGGGKLPIYLEAVPAGTSGTFVLLNVPSDGDGDALDDLKAVAADVTTMLVEKGFGAKTSSGFGSAEDQLVGEGKLAIRADLGGTSPAAGEAASSGPQPDALTASIAQFLQRFSVPEFPRWTDSELGASGWGGTRASAYKRLRDSHPDWDRQGRTWIEREAVTAEAPPAPAAPPIGERAFAHLSDLPGVARQVADELRQGGAQ